MKIHLKKRITDKIMDAIVEAKESNREVESIELTPDEWREFNREVPFQITGRKVCKYMGVTVYVQQSVEQLRDRHASLRGWGLGGEY